MNFYQILSVLKNTTFLAHFATFFKACATFLIRRMGHPVENTFVLLCARWRILLRPMETQVDNSISIVKAACVLHNFLCSNETDENNPTTLADNGDEPNGLWRQHIPQQLAQAKIRHPNANKTRRDEVEIRNKLMHYLTMKGLLNRKLE
jgi:hypothetical protein